MTRVVGIRFSSGGKEYHFDPGILTLEVGEKVIVETSRGLEFGTVTSAPYEEVMEKPDRPLKKVVRIATEQDKAKNEEEMARREKAMNLCQEKVEEHNLDMKLVDAEYSQDGRKIVFYFTSEGRVDFRNLVKDLASVFHARIELRQIGVRDEARLLGGVGNCGRGLCCHEWMANFQPVSIKMAKTQNLSLNPTKISGMCGRLMCCLKFENEIYQELGKGMPNVGERIEIPEGIGIVTDVNILLDKVKCRLVTTETNAEGEEYEKLSSELYTYGKEEVTRLGKKGGLKNPPKKKKAPKKAAGKEEEQGGEEGKPREAKRKRRRRRRGKGREGAESAGESAPADTEQ